jgi:putative transposase
MCAIRRSSHAVYDLKYHLVWTPKYRKRILVDEVAEYAEHMLQRAAESYDMVIDTLEVEKDHVHVFLEAPPKYSPARIAQILKSISARELFQRFSWLRDKLWGGELWEDGYFVRSVGDQVTSEIIRRYIKYQDEQRDGTQLKLWDGA